MQTRRGSEYLNQQAINEYREKEEVIKANIVKMFQDSKKIIAHNVFMTTLTQFNPTAIGFALDELVDNKTLNRKNNHYSKHGT